MQETRGEMKQVKWPSRRTAMLFTILVVVVSVLTALYLGLFDFIFTTGLKNLLG